MLTFSSVGPFFEEGGGALEKFGQKLKFLGFFQLRSPLRCLGLVLMTSKAYDNHRQTDTRKEI